MVSARAQLEELKKPNPRYVLELHTIRGMIQEADNMDKGLKTVLAGLGIRSQGPMMPSTPQPPPQPTPATAAQFAPSVPPTAPSAPTTVPRPPHAATLHRKKQSQSQPLGMTLSSPTPPLIPSTSTPTPQVTTPGITAPSPQTPKSPKPKPAPKAKQPPRRKVSAKTNSVGTPTPAPAPSTPTSSAPVDGKGGAKRVREDETDAPTPGVQSAPSPKRAKPDWEGPPNEEARKRDEEAENVKTDEQANALFEHLAKLIDENPESAEAASNALDAILRTCPTAPEMDDSRVAPSLNFPDLQPMSPSHPVGQDFFGDYIDYSAFDDTPTPDLVAGSSTNPSPESASDQDHPHTNRAGSSPQIRNGKKNDAYEFLPPAAWREISGVDTMFHQAQGWKFDGTLDAPDSAWAISS